MRRAAQALSLVAGLGALAVLFAWFGVEDVAAAIRRTRPGYLVLYLALAGVIRLGYSVRWFGVARTFGPTPSFGRFVAARLAGDAVGALIPTGSVGGDPVRIVLLYGRCVGSSAASAGVALDRLMELFGNTICAVAYVSVFSFTKVLAPEQGTSLALGVATVPFLVLLAALAAPLVLLRFGLRPVSPALPARWLERWPRTARALDLVRRTEDDLMVFVRERPGMLLGGILGSLLIEALIVADYYLLLAAFGVDLGLPTLLMMIVTLGLVRVAPVPAGLGALEVGQVTLLAAAKGRADLGFLVGVVLRLHETLWMAVGLAALSLQGLSLARVRQAAVEEPIAGPVPPPRSAA